MKPDIKSHKCLRYALFTVLSCVLLACSIPPLNKEPASENAMLDCPLRDKPFSIHSPLMDIMLSQAASDIVNQHMGGVLENIPSSFASTTPPSFSAILSLVQLAGMGDTPAGVLTAIESELATLEVSDEDRIARCQRYDMEPPTLEIPAGSPRLLLFEKINGFRDVPSVEAAATALKALAHRNGWSMASTENGAVMTAELLSNFDAVIWNNISGDVLTLSQRKAFETYINDGGGFVGIHGSGGDFLYFWDWYVDELLGARFIGHPMEPQFQDARVRIENTDSGIGSDLSPGWTMNDEWYSFKASPRLSGAQVVATLDENSYSPVGRGGQNLRMGDHPIAWTRCVGNGRSFYSAIGHRPETYAQTEYLALLEQAIIWAAGKGKAKCAVE